MREEKTTFGILQFHENYVISTVNGGIDFDKRCVDLLIETLNHTYGQRPFAYISNRVHDYSLNPAEAKRLISETSMVAAAFVLVRRFSQESFQTERVFYKFPTAAFDSMDEAVVWVKTHLASLPNQP